MELQEHKDPEGGEGLERGLALEPVTTEGIGESLTTARNSTQRGLKSRHAQMIALGGTIGTGLFVGSGQALALGGPMSLLLTYAMISFFLFGVASATGEMSSYLPVPGASVPYYATRFVSPSLGFAMGWMYWYTMGITVAAEVTACVLVIDYWNVPVNPAVWTTISLCVIVALNCFPVKIYGETEFWFASLKVFTILGLILLSVVLFFGGGPTHQPLYFKNWSHPGPFKEYLFPGDKGRLCGFLATLPFSFYAFAFAPELLVVTGGEMQNPRRNLPKATRKLIWRLIIFYVVGAFCIGCIIKSDNSSLRGGSDAGSSPWAIGIREAGIHGLDSLVNAAILLSAWSAGNSYFYLTSRMLYSMALSGAAPKVFANTTRHGIPYWATLVTILWSFLAYLNVSNSGVTVFSWLVNINNTGGYESWVCCCIIYICFRKAADAQSITDLPYRSKMQPYLSWASGLFFFVLMLISGFQVLINGQWDAKTFVSAYIGIPVFIGTYAVHRFTIGRSDPWKISTSEVDLQTGLQEIKDEETVEVDTHKWYMAWTKVLW